jgi:hypothetical protein
MMPSTTGLFTRIAPSDVDYLQNKVMLSLSTRARKHELIRVNVEEEGATHISSLRDANNLGLLL